ncbi:hypothetical protein L9F63_012661, partial [Diploptera punctata]
IKISFVKTFFSRTYFFIVPKLGLDLVPRVGAHMVDPDTMSVVELYHVHACAGRLTGCHLNAVVL